MTWFIALNLGASFLNMVSAGLLVYGAIKLREAVRLNNKTLNLLRNTPDRSGEADKTGTGLAEGESKDD